MRHFIVISILVTAFVLAACVISAAAPQQNTTAPAMSAANAEQPCDHYRALKEFDQAITCFQEAIRNEPRNPRLYNKLGLAQLSAGDYEAARASFIKATKLDHNYPEAWNDRGVVAYIDKDYRIAVKYFSKAIALNEGRPNFHVNLGITYFTMNQMDQAMVQYTRALELDPEALSHSSNTGLSAQLVTREERAKMDFMMAKIYANMGNNDACLESLRQAKDNGYASMKDVYKDECFSEIRKDPRLAEIVPPPLLK